MTLSNAGIASLLAQETGEVWLTLLTIRHADLPAPERLVLDLQPVVSRGETYLPASFDIRLPNQSGDAPPRVTLSLDNVDRRLIELLRTITEPPMIDIEIVLASDPDTVELSLPDFELKDVKYNKLAVTGTLGFEDFLAEPYPGATFTPGDFPGLFS